MILSPVFFVVFFCKGGTNALPYEKHELVAQRVDANITHHALRRVPLLDSGVSMQGKSWRRCIYMHPFKTFHETKGLRKGQLVFI